MKQTLLVSAVLLVLFFCYLEAIPEADIKDVTDEQKKAIQILNNTDIDELIKDKNEVDKKLACILEEATCDGDEIVESIKILLHMTANASRCEGCTPKLRAKIIKAMKFIKYNLRERYDQIIQKIANGEEPPELEAL